MSNSYRTWQPSTVMTKNPKALLEALDDHVRSHELHGKEWPADAELACAYRTKTWPCGWGEVRVVFFQSVEQMKSWIADYENWATLEDNEFEYDAYRWNLGPVLLGKYDISYAR